MKYKLIASDFDNTIYDGHAVSPRVLAAITAYRRAGGRFVVATGRIYESIRKKMPLLDADDELIACQGAALYSASTGEVYARFPLPPEVARTAVEYFESIGAVCHGYADREFYVEKKNPYSDWYAAYCETSPTYLGYPLSRFLPEMEATNKVISILPEDEIDGRMIELREILGSSAEVTKSAPMFLEVTSSQAGKGNCLVALAERLGIPMEETVAVGDNLNDLSMILVAGIGAAVGNSVPGLIEHADLILPPITEDGVAVLLERAIADEL